VFRKYFVESFACIICNTYIWDMGDKYYTPEIEEFRVGFECEIMSSYGFQKGLYPEILKEETLNNFGGDSLVSLKQSTFRVKYLDGDDIESLGFNRLTDDCYNLPVKEFRGRLDQEVRIIVRKTILIYLAMDMGDKDNMVLFTGNIKNLSELKVLLKQLNIK
jgi:hypothetical protein